MATEIQEHTFDTGTVQINFAEGPLTGAPSVLLHGGSVRWQSFEEIIPPLAKHWHVFALDFRGHGKSSRAPSYRLQGYTNDVIAFLDQCVAQPAFIFGHSLGGMVALLVAAQRPDRVRAVIVGDSPLSAETWHAALHQSRERLTAWRDLAGGQVPLEEMIERLKASPVEVPSGSAPNGRMPRRATSATMREVMGEDSPYFEWMATNLYHNDPAMLTALLDDFENVAAGYEVEAVLSAIRCPVLLIQADLGEGGALMTDAEVKQARSLHAQLSHVRLTGISHALHHTHPEQVAHIIEDYLSSL